MLMTRSEYRKHMRRYSRDTMVMSFVVTDHPDYQAIRDAGEVVVPWLLDDLLDPHWHCSACSGYGYEFVPTWREEWETNKAYPPRSTGNACPKCDGRGNVNTHACMTLLWTIVGRDAGPKIENWMRGRHDLLVNLWRKWGEEHGYLLPSKPYAEPREGWLARLFRKLFGA